MKKQVKFGVVLITLILMLIPTIYVVTVSIFQIQRYKVSSNFKVIEKSYSQPTLLERKDFIPYFIMSGKVESNSKEILAYDYNLCPNPIILVKLSDDIFVDQPILQCGNTQHKSTASGVLDDIVMANSLNFIINTTDHLVFKTQVDFTGLEKYKQNFKVDNLILSYKYESSILHDDKISVFYDIETTQPLFINQNLELNIILNDDVINAFSIIKEAVFIKNRSTFVRLVSENGDVIGDYEVIILAENIGQFAFRFKDDLNDPIYIDIEYGVYMNRLDRESYE